MRRKREFQIVFLIFLLSLILKLAIIVITGSFKHPVVFEYEETARNILAGHGFCNVVLGQNYYAYLEPLYPLLSALFYKFTPFGQGGLLILGTVISSLLGVVIYFIVKNIFSSSVGLVAYILTILHPGLIIYATKNLHPLVCDAFFFSLLALMLLKVNDKPELRSNLITGLVLGLTVLSRSTVILFIPLAFLWFLFNPIHDKKTKFTTLATIIFVTLIVLAPWQIRNQIRFKKFVFISSSKGQHLWRGNNIQASGTLWYGPKTYTEAMPEELKNKISGKGELEQDKVFRKEALTFIANHPFQFLTLWLKKFYYFWWFSPYAGKEYPSPWLRVYRLYYSLMLIAFIIGTGAALRKNNQASSFKAILLILLMSTISLGQSLFYVEGRHRWEIESLLLVFAAFFLKGLGQKLKLKKQKIGAVIDTAAGEGKLRPSRPGAGLPPGSG